ncbi:hypothetical protein Stsp02_22780 [Streptomyces sp. NBRC 14336]|nr:hypothetical protein Stsp02_22780 [Streptomyces sp. NBRC 14336]
MTGPLLCVRVPMVTGRQYEPWLKLSRTDTEEIRNLGGWLTTVVGRVCLDLLRSRATRREDPLDDTLVPDPVIRPLPRTDPEQEVLRADSVGLAMMVVLETLEPAERLAFVLHDMFAVPFDDIARIVERSPAATRQLASRARRRVRGATPPTEPDLGRHRQVLDAFLTACRAGDFDALLELLDPGIVLRADSGPLVGGAAASKMVRGAAGGRTGNAVPRVRAVRAGRAGGGRARRQATVGHGAYRHRRPDHRYVHPGRPRAAAGLDLSDLAG